MAIMRTQTLGIMRSPWGEEAEEVRGSRGGMQQLQVIHKVTSLSQAVVAEKPRKGWGGEQSRDGGA